VQPIPNDADKVIGVNTRPANQGAIDIWVGHDPDDIARFN
jgi:hypothetical protein